MTAAPDPRTPDAARGEARRYPTREEIGCPHGSNSRCDCYDEWLADHQPDAPTREGVRLTSEDLDLLSIAIGDAITASPDARIGVDMTPIRLAVERILERRLAGGDPQ